MPTDEHTRVGKSTDEATDAYSCDGVGELLTKVPRILLEKSLVLDVLELAIAILDRHEHISSSPKCLLGIA
jgi:hypothetical protein